MMMSFVSIQTLVTDQPLFRQKKYPGEGLSQHFLGLISAAGKASSKNL
jgi:hypothetical protein